MLCPQGAHHPARTRDQLAKIAKVSEVVLDAEVKLGELIAAMPTKQGARTDLGTTRYQGSYGRTKESVAFLPRSPLFCL